MNLCDWHSDCLDLIRNVEIPSAVCQTVTMKKISICEPHERTGAWVREAARIGPLVIPNRGKPVARREAVTADFKANPFLTRKLRPGYLKLRGKLGGGAGSALIVSGGRDSR